MKSKLVPLTGLAAMLLFGVFLTTAQAQFESSGNFFDDFDSDGDGVVTQEEFTGPEGHFDNLDTDGSGSIDADEGPTGPPEEPSGDGPRDGGPQGDGPRDGGPQGDGSGGNGPGNRN